MLSDYATLMVEILKDTARPEAGVRGHGHGLGQACRPDRPRLRKVIDWRKRHIPANSRARPLFKHLVAQRAPFHQIIQRRAQFLSPRRKAAFDLRWNLRVDDALDYAIALHPAKIL